MSFLVPRLAVRNVRRHVRRSLLSGSVVFFGVFFLIIARGVIDGLEYGTVRAQIDANCAHLRCLPAGADDDGFDLPLEPRLSDVDGLLRAARAVDGFEAAAPRVRFSAEVSNGRDSLRVIAIGVDPSADGAVFVLGTDPRSMVGEPAGVLLGSGIMTLLDLSAGDAITLVARTPEGAISALDFVVKGAFATGNPAVDNLHALLPIDAARQLLALGPSEATEVAVRLHHQRQATGAAAALQASAGAGVRVESWVEATEDIRSLMRVRRRGMSVIVGVLMAIAAAGIANTVLMAVFERFREIGTLMAFGFPPSAVRRMFFLEGVALGLFGSLAGMAAGGVVVTYFERHGIDLSSITTSPDVVYPVAEILYTEFTLEGLLLSGLFGVVVSALATVGPARRAALLQPVEALRA